MGNFGRFDHFVDEFDPYEHRRKVEEREKELAYNTGARDARYDRSHNELLDSQDRERARLKGLRDSGMTEYEDRLDQRGLLGTDIEFESAGDDGRMHPGKIRARGKIDPATAALLKEAAGQGLIGGKSAWINSAENRSALAQLMEGKKADAIREQSRVDAQTLEDKKLQAIKDEQASRRADAASSSDREFQHGLALMQAKQEAATSDPTAQLQRELMSAQIGAQKVGMQRAQDEYRSPDDESAMAQARSLAPAAMGGDMQAYAALQNLRKLHPKSSIDVETYRPSAEKVLAQPAIQQKMGEIDSLIKNNNWHIDSTERQAVMSKAREAVAAAGEFGPQAQEAVKQRILLALNGTGSLFGSLGSSDMRSMIDNPESWSQP